MTTPAAQAPEGTTVCVQATMVTPMRTHLIRKGMTLYKADFTDGETLIHVTLFNTKFLAEKLRMYQDYLLRGGGRGTPPPSRWGPPRLNRSLLGGSTPFTPKPAA